MNKPVKWEKPNIVFAGLSQNKLEASAHQVRKTDEWTDMLNSESNFPASSVGSILPGLLANSACRSGFQACDPSGKEEEKSIPGPECWNPLSLLGHEVAVSSGQAGARSERAQGTMRTSALGFLTGFLLT